MRIKITCDIGEGIRLPINYNYFLASAIYGFLRESDPEYADFLHQDGYELENRRFKLFTFSQLMAKQREIRGDQIHFRSPLTWYVSSSQEPFLENFAATLMGVGILQIERHQASGAGCGSVASTSLCTPDDLSVPLTDYDVY